ncbi:hypothetical protein M9Y10_015508 [Tritrichomonas musculus]|uniref:Ubiquitin-like domain-containing protein n=1 Tax=Tritrichomonas musculus TaxID=1915356 RepID=A0ABR2L2H1_9EUKA
MDVSFRDIVGKKHTIKISPDKPIKDTKDELFTKFKADPKKKDIKFTYNKNQIDEDATFESIGYKEGEFITFQLIKRTEAKPISKTVAPPEKEDNNKKPEQQVQANKSLPQQPKPEKPPESQKSQIYDETIVPITKSPYPRVDSSQPYPIPDQTQENIDRQNCINIRRILVNNGINLIIDALQNINPELSERVKANPEPFCLLLGLAKPSNSGESNFNSEEIMSEYTREEKNSIERLKKIEPNQQKVLQVFEALGRNENNAKLILQNL